MALTFAAAHACASWCVAQTATAPAIVWRGPSDCQRQAAVNERFRVLVAETDQVQGLEVEARVTQARRRDWELDLALNYRGRAARRRVQARSCDDLVEATAVLLALAVTEEEQNGGKNPASTSVPAPGPPPSPVAPSEVHEPPSPEKQRRAAWRLPPLGMQVDLGFALDTGRGGSGYVGAALGWYEERGLLALGARYQPPVALANRLAVTGATVRVDALDLDLTGCLSASGQSARWLGCAAMSVTRYAVQTTGITIPAEVAGWSPGVSLGAGLLFPLGTRAFAALVVDGRLRAPRAFVVRGIERVAYQAPALGGSARASLGAHF
jgi:hypothetical protein